MKLQKLAEHTLNIEFPGMSLEKAQVAASERSYDSMNEIWRLKDELQHIQYLLDQATQDYHETTRAAALFENALTEINDEKNR